MRKIALALLFSVAVGAAGYALLSGKSGLADPVDGFASGPGTATEAGGRADDEAGAGSDSAASGRAGETGDDTATGSEGGARRIVYQWVDERGSVHFAGSLDEVPEDWRGRAGQIELDPAALSPSAGGAAHPGGSRAATRTVADVPSRPVHEVTIYTAPWCGWCRKTMTFLDERGVDYVNKDIEADPTYAAELQEKSGGTAVPFVEIDDQTIPGYDPNAMAAMLD